MNDLGHLVVGGCDVVKLAEQFGTPLWLIDEATIEQACRAVKAGLSEYPKTQVLYAGKAFLCLAMCHLIKRLGLGLDVVSIGELMTASRASFPPELIYLHGNNKSQEEIAFGLNLGDIKIVVDSVSELYLIQEVAAHLQRRAKILLRVTPGVEPDTHHYIRTGQADSKFGLPLENLSHIVELAQVHSDCLELIGLHAHIGSQSHEIEPYLEIIEILADCFVELQHFVGLTLTQLDVGGGLGIAYTPNDHPTPLYEWSRAIARHVEACFTNRNLALPTLLVEPGRAIVGTAGITLYRAGHCKNLPGGITYIALNGGMADNPRPITYQARYTPCLANRLNDPCSDKPITFVGKYCESGDIIVKDAYLAAESGDLVAIFGTGAYNYSMASNYNRTGRPACILVAKGQSEVIIKRESPDDLIARDRVPQRLLVD
ncbi:MAG: diaminopimelate decarboxylase [Candidatus Melainabacteria bacterium]|nr:diaminopimelate decarboxylase [Candidatus Melainabacteria bacterium]